MNYIDIGHGNAASQLWLYCDGRIDVAGRSSHSEIWGTLAHDCWRGRCETMSRRVSIVPPLKNGHPPEPPPWLISALKKKFGDDIQIHSFDWKYEQYNPKEE